MVGSVSAGGAQRSFSPCGSGSGVATGASGGSGPEGGAGVGTAVVGTRAAAGGLPMPPGAPADARARDAGAGDAPAADDEAQVERAAGA